MANEEHIHILKQGVAVWNKWRNDNPEIKPDLSKVSLHDADLNWINFVWAYLGYIDFTDTNLSEANLTMANLGGVDLTETNLTQATLIHADLFGATLDRTDLTRADLTGVSMGFNILADLDLRTVKGLETINHVGPSTIGIDTIYRSKGDISYKFLLDAGIPQETIGYLLSLAGKPIDFYSCFISYSSKDQNFAERLHADLQAKGVRCWYAPEDLSIGEPFLLGIDKGIRLHDKLLLILSEHSVTSGWVQHEVLAALAKEQGKAPWVLFPICIDDAIMNTSVPWATMLKQSRHIGDFTHWKDHDAYQKAFERLLRDLKARA